MKIMKTFLESFVENVLKSVLENVLASSLAADMARPAYLAILLMFSKLPSPVTGLGHPATAVLKIKMGVECLDTIIQ